MAMQSSPTENWQPKMRTKPQLSGSKPSVLWEFLGPSMDRQSASTCSHRMGWMFHAGLLRTVKPAKLTFSHSDRKIMRGRATSRPSSGRKMFLKSLFHQLSSAKSV